jgi:O-antigen biosynthesis protein WbqP
MKCSTPILAANKIIKPEKYLILFGKFLRNFGIDELPQLYNILKGDMTFVGPRPALFNHKSLNEERIRRNIGSIKPGLTGLALINGRNNLDDAEKAVYDEIYMHNASLYLDVKIIFCTFIFLVCGRNSRNWFKFRLKKKNEYIDSLTLNEAEYNHR